MPTYEYECKSCGHGFEVFQAMSDPPLRDCPECGKEVRRLIFGGTGVIFKGSGFYVTDKNKSTVRTASKDNGKTDTKTASANSTGKSDSAPKESSASGENSIERSSSKERTKNSTDKSELKSSA